MSKIVQDPVILRQKSESVASVKEATDLISKLEKVLSECNNGVGLAAIQLGIAKKVGVIRYGGKSFDLINSELVEQEEEFIHIREGCLSIPNTFRNIKRYRHVTIKNDVIDGDIFRRETWYFYCSDNKDDNSDGMCALAIQHELDHFNAKLIVDHEDIKPEPIKKTEKIGRNDPCPCGKLDKNGKPVKYKKCCLKS